MGLGKEKSRYVKMETFSRHWIIGGLKADRERKKDFKQVSDMSLEAHVLSRKHAREKREGTEKIAQGQSACMHIYNYPEPFKPWCQ